MKAPAWLDAHVQAFAFFGGVAQIIVPDNPTTSTHQTHKGDTERVVKARYQQLADHYETAIVPARVNRPRDKAAAENAVNAVTVVTVVNKRVIGYLDGDVFATLTELNGAIGERVREINHDIRRADDTTRWERFTTEEAALHGLLPSTPSKLLCRHRHNSWNITDVRSPRRGINVNAYSIIDIFSRKLVGCRVENREVDALAVEMLQGA
jgi:hypothetical protein